MHVQTHVMSGWCVANLLSVTPKERLFAMLAASAADFDGLGILVSGDYYVTYHHVLGHNLVFGVALACSLAIFSTHRLKAFWLFLALFHLHLILDYYGSGPGWGIFYLWPFSRREFLNLQAWNFFSWQNLSAAGFFLLWVFGIALKRGRTPLELILPSLDQKIVRALRRMF